MTKTMGSVLRQVKCCVPVSGDSGKGDIHNHIEQLSFIKGIILSDFLGLFMILSYSLDVSHVPHHILFLNFMF
jgi:hypothetical protein